MTALIPFDLAQTEIEGLVIVAAVERALHIELRNIGERMRQFRRPHEVAAPKLNPVDIEFARSDVEHPLAEKIGLKASRSAIRANWRLVRHEHRDVHMEIGDAIGTRQNLRAIERRAGTV